MVKKILNKFINKIKIFIKILIKIFFYLPIFRINTKKIIFSNFAGKGFGDNPKYIALELIRQNVECKMIWLVNDLNEDIPNKIKKIKHNSIRAMYEVATAKIWINNIRNDHLAYKKKKQFYIQTWHGSGIGLKKIEGECKDFLNEKYLREAKKDGEYTDLMLCDNDYFYDIIKKYFWFYGEILKCSLPRNDIFFENNLGIREKVYSFYNINKNYKIILYVPTFRSVFDNKVYVFNFNKLIDTCNKKFGNNYVLLIRLHPALMNENLDIKYNEKIIDATKYPSVDELLCVADIGITDISGCSLQFLLQKKPIFSIFKDYKNYIKNERGIRENFYFPININTEERDLFSEIKSFDIDEYNNRVNIFMNKVNFYENGNGSKKVVEKIKEVLK